MLIVEDHWQAKYRGDSKEHRLLNRSVQECCHRDREAYLDQSCNEILKHADHSETGAVYKKICQIARDCKPRTCQINKHSGIVVAGF